MKELSYLSELEKESIVKFNKDSIMKEAVRKVLLSVLYRDGILSADSESKPFTNIALVAASRGKSDEEVGKEVNKIFTCISLIEGAFQDLEKIKEEVPAKKEVKPNPAR